MSKEFYLGYSAKDIKTDLEKGVVRKSIVLSRTSGVFQDESDAIKRGIGKILFCMGSTLKLVDVGNANLGNQDYGSTDWYQESSRVGRDIGFGEQISALKVDQLLRDEPYQGNNPHYDFFLLDKDLTTGDGNNFVFGYGPYPNNIISVVRFRDYIRDKALRLTSLSICSAHEFAHNFDLVFRNFNTGTSGYHIGHCMGESGPCLMEQVDVGGKTLKQQAKLLVDRENWLCPDCMGELISKKNHFNSLGVVM